LVGLVSYLLVNFWYTRIAANMASMSALFINKIGDLFFMLAIVLAIGLFSDLSLSTIFSMIPHLNSDLIFILSICFIGAAAAKSALIPLHTWLPKAMEGQSSKVILGIKNKEKLRRGKCRLKNDNSNRYKSTYTKEKIDTSIKLPESVKQN
jgi:NADH:ubiquinone oxidoreductase subunit 4 (subunit M)